MFHQYDSKMKKSKALKISFFLSLSYVGLGTLCVLSMYPMNYFMEDGFFGDY